MKHDRYRAYMRQVEARYGRPIRTRELARHLLLSERQTGTWLRRWRDQGLVRHTDQGWAST